MFTKLTKAVFFGNYFCGICAVALSIEASLQQRYPLNGAEWYVFVFAVSVVYYTYAYLGEPLPKFANERTLWYLRNGKSIRAAQVIFSAMALTAAIYMLVQHGKSLFLLKPWQWYFIILLPMVACSYYGVPMLGLEKYNLRRAGWLKPFLIGFVWAGCTTIFPLIYYQAENSKQYALTYTTVLLFVKNLMYISVMGIMFDIKDYASDSNLKLQTFVVRVGLRKTLFYIIMPLTILGFVSFLAFAVLSRFPGVRICFNAVPFIAMLFVAYSMHRRKSIMYYLVVIDGLMLVKAICGILGMLLIN